MATPCNALLAKAPFETYRDPATGEWQLEKAKVETNSKTAKIIPFRRPVSAEVHEQELQAK